MNDLICISSIVIAIKLSDGPQFMDVNHQVNYLQ